MLENAIYSVISPEGCASILWRDPKKTLEAAEAMKLAAKDLLELGVIDEIISEPIGGAHRDKDLCIDNVRKAIEKNLVEMNEMNRDETFLHRKNKFLSIGRSKGFSTTLDSDENLIMKENLSVKIFNKINKFKIPLSIIFGFLFFVIVYYLL
tara:strand:- start:553 stop:1008 length:456 start_codon:yes stop_codon:yes gene_type:complete